MIRVTENIHYTPKLSTTSVQILSRWTTVPKFKSHATHRYEWWVQTNVYLSHDRPRATRNFTRRITDLVVVLFLKRETLCRSHRNKMKSSFFTFVRLDKSISNKLYSFLLLLLFLLPDVFSLFQQDKTKTGKITKKNRGSQRLSWSCDPNPGHVLDLDRHNDLGCTRSLIFRTPRYIVV